MITGILVALIGGPAFFTLVREPVLETAKITKYDSSRAPASEGAQVSSVVLEKGTYHKTVSEKNAFVQLNCQDENLVEKSEQEVQASALRIAGFGCKKENSIQIRNQTNGFTAEVIFTQENQFTTDYIDLSVGQNDLEIISTQKDGTKINQKLKISRRAPAAIQN